MKYFVFAPILFIYFDLLGRLFFLKIKKEKIEFPFVIGMIFTMAVLYIIGWPISAFDLASIYYVALLLIFFVITTILIIVNFKKLDFKINYKLWILLAILLAFEIYMSWNRTLGDPHGFDAVYYINYISQNVDTPSLNSLHPLFGTFPNTWETKITYVFQSYNYFISSFIFIAQKLFSLINKELDFLPLYVWTFQILLHIFFISTSIISIKELNIKNKIAKISFIILLVLFLNNIYYNNAYGFIGNTYRMSIHAIATIFLFRYFDSKDKKDLFIFFLSMLGLCGFSSTGTFATIFVLFGLFFVLYNKEENLIKYYSLVLFVPVLNILCVKLGVNWVIVIITLIVFTIIYFLNNTILKLYKNKYIRYGTIIAVTILMIVSSIIVSKDNNIFYAFINNYSEKADMSWDYFDFYDYKHWIFNPIVLAPLAYYLIKNRKEPFTIITIILIVTVFNPLGGNFINKINWVYYRTYDIIINQFTLVYFINFLLHDFEYNKILTILLLGLSSILAIVEIPCYWHFSFKPDNNYNHLYKIENSELEMIRNVQQLIKDENIEHPRIINCTYYMNSFIKNGSYMIGKEKTFDYDHQQKYEYELYCILYPIEDGLDINKPNNPAYYNMTTEYLKSTNYDIIIVSNNHFVNSEGLKYYPIADVIIKDNTYKKSEYSTSEYSVIIKNTN